MKTMQQVFRVYRDYGTRDGMIPICRGAGLDDLADKMQAVLDYQEKLIVLYSEIGKSLKSHAESLDNGETIQQESQELGQYGDYENYILTVGKHSEYVYDYKPVDDD